MNISKRRILSKEKKGSNEYIYIYIYNGQQNI
jgi:hypothetical protein